MHSGAYIRTASQDVALRVRYSTGARRPCDAPKERAMQDHGFDLRRILLPRTSVNKGRRPLSVRYEALLLQEPFLIPRDVGEDLGLSSDRLDEVCLVELRKHNPMSSLS